MSARGSGLTAFDTCVQSCVVYFGIRCETAFLTPCVSSHVPPQPNLVTPRNEPSKVIKVKKSNKYCARSPGSRRKNFMVADEVWCRLFAQFLDWIKQPTTLWPIWPLVWELEQRQRFLRYPPIIRSNNSLYSTRGSWHRY